MKTLKEFKSLIDSGLEDFFKEKLFSATTDEEKELINILKDYTLRGGKRIRAYLIYLSYTGLGGKDLDKAINASLSMELIQSALLIHDDIIDEDDLRRKGITPHAYYRKEYSGIFKNKADHMGNSFAMLCGDLAYVYSNELLARTKDASVIEEFNKIISKVIFGQKRDLLANKIEYSEEDIIKNYILKTATYTFLGPLKIGSMLAGKDVDLEEFSNDLGIAFQIQDDLLDVYGSEETLGKSIGSDIKEGKRTLLLIKALEKTEDKKLLKNPSIEEARKIFKETKAKEYCEKLMKEKYENSLSRLETLGFSSDSKKKLRAIIEKLMNREY